MKYSEKKMNSLKKGEGVPLLNFELYVFTKKIFVKGKRLQRVL